MTGIWLYVAIGSAALAVILLLYFLSGPVLRELEEHEHVVGAKWRER